MKIEVILEIVSGVFLALGCVLYIIYNQNQKDEENKKTLLIILSIIFTAAGIGLFIGTTNKPHVPSQEENTEIIDENVNENQIDP